MGFADELIKGILSGSLKFLGLTPLLNLTNGVAGGGALTKPRPSAVARPKREIRKCAGMSLTKESVEFLGAP